jgi:SAM-dependent methyltransferase
MQQSHSDSSVLDHSLTYRVRALRNLPHRMRLRTIEREVRRLNLAPAGTYADFGCSNGYITERVRRLTRAGQAWGFDYLEAHLARARALYPKIEFIRIDLNRPNNGVPKCDLVTCFETLEHVGDLDVAVDNLLSALAPHGTALFTVPIEIGARGALKFALKLAYGYDLSELPQQPSRFRRYVSALLIGGRISQFRDRRSGWGTHFGFDYREVDDVLQRREVRFETWNSGTTRFYRIQAP